MSRETDLMRPNPNPRIVALLDYALDEVTARLTRKSEFGDWLEWSASWKAGRRAPQSCVEVAHRCFEHKDWGIDGSQTDPIWHSLGQLAWGAKEACYSTPTSGWLVIRYIADAMIAFGIAFPEKGMLALERPTSNGEHLIENTDGILQHLPAPPPQSSEGE